MRGLNPFGLEITAAVAGEKLCFTPEELRGLAAEAPLVVLRGYAPLSQEEFLRLAARNVAGDLLHWDFGPVMDLQVKAQAENYLFSREPVPFHWDGAFHREPSYLLFQCVAAPSPGAGGETTFCWTEKVLARASEGEREIWDATRLTYRTEKKAHYGGAVTVPMVGRHPRTGRAVLKYAEPVCTELNPVALEVSGPRAGDAAAFVEEMRARLYDPAVCYEHAWQDGDILIADNHSLLHGRRGFHDFSPRHIRRVQLL